MPIRAFTAVLALLVWTFCAAAQQPTLAASEMLEGPLAPPELTEHLQETPFLEPRVQKGELPPVSERVPQEPALVHDPEKALPGRIGGELRSLVGRSKDVRMMVVYGYARLVGYDAEFNLVPDILHSVESEDERIFTLKLRSGHRWSDGHPFTSEDFRYYWEDVALNEDLSPAGPPSVFLVDGELPTVEIVDETTVRYSWSAPNPLFLHALAGARPEEICLPAHYLKRFHNRYADLKELERAVEENSARNWAQLHNRMESAYAFDNPEMPTLQPWINTTPPPSERFVGERNPFFHRIDEDGQQLPYLDRFILNVVGGGLIPLKTSAGEAELQARGLNFTDYTFLKSAEQRSDYIVQLWPTARGSQIALYPNLNHNDPVWRALFRDVRFRRALSLAINRHELNQVLYFGLGLPGNNLLLPSSPLADPGRRERWAQFDLATANRLLDEIGLSARDDRGVRLLPDGRPLEIIVESAGENSEEVDALELIHDSWLDAGIKLFIKTSQREVLRNRVFAGDTQVAVWFGLENGIATSEMSPAELAPVSQHNLQWPKWGQYFETKGQSGEEIDMPLPKRLLDLYHQWMRATDRASRREAWTAMLEIHADEIFTIGLVAQIPQPVVVANGLRNVPESAIFNWEPGAQFGIYRPDIFWWDR